MSTTLANETRTLPSGTWRSDGIHSAVGFAVRHMIVSTFRGELPEFEVTLVADDGGARLEGTVDRREFDINWNMPLPGGGLAVGNDVRLVAQVELVREG